MNVKAIVTAFAVVALTACAAQRTLPTVSPSQPHGTVIGQEGVGADRTHPVEIIMINGVNVPHGGSNHFLLAPGDYTIRLMPAVRMTTEIGTIGQRGPRGDQSKDLRITVEDGVRYTVAAHVPGPHASDWRPVVQRADRRSADLR